MLLLKLLQVSLSNMVIPTAIITTLVKGIVGLLKQFGVPLAAFFAGKQNQSHKNLKEAHEVAKIASEMDDGVSRASDDALDRVLHD